MSARPRSEPSARRAESSDIDDLARLRWLWRAVERGERGDPEKFRTDFAAWVTDHQSTHLPFVVEVDGSPVGMAWLAIMERIPGPERWHRRSGHLQSVYVVAERRNDGLGGHMVRKLIEVARVEELEYLSVHPSARSYPFYRRLGFTGEGDLLILRLG